MATSPPQVSLDEIREEVADLETPEERIGYLIELGQTLPDLPVEYQTEIFRVLGCQSMVWVVPEMRGKQLYFRGTSDAPMVRGLVAILISAYSGRSSREILDFPIESLFEELRLKSFLTPMRSNGLYSMVQRIQAIARESLAASGEAPEVAVAIGKSGSDGPEFSVATCREDFPILAQCNSDDRPLIYLDNAASSQRPSSVIDCMSDVYRTHYANVHRFQARRIGAKLHQTKIAFRCVHGSPPFKLAFVEKSSRPALLANPPHQSIDEESCSLAHRAASGGFAKCLRQQRGRETIDGGELGLHGGSGLRHLRESFPQPRGYSPLIGERREFDWNATNAVLRDILHRAARPRCVQFDEASTRSAPQRELQVLS